MIELIHFNILSLILFSIGLYGVLARKSAILIIMAIELMLNAVNINFIAVAAFNYGDGLFTDFDGHILTIFIITIAAAEVGLALALILRIFRNKSTVNVDQFDMMKW